MTLEPDSMPSVSKNNFLAQKKNFLEVRSRLLMSIRTFFHYYKFLEIDTPTRIPIPALEDYIDAISADGQYLRTSPEFHMKRLIASGYDKIFQIGPCFRKGEFGDRHRPEFTMLEWYETGADYMDILKRTESLIKGVSGDLGIREDYFQQSWEVMSVADAFEIFAGKDVFEVIKEGTFEEILCFEIEPHLGKDKPLFLIDYPASMAALSRKKKDNPNFAERWELYIDGLEIANAYSELTDPVEQRERFIETAKLREREGREVYELDEDFLSALEDGMPDCGGIAVGIDRLCMAFCETPNISDVVFE